MTTANLNNLFAQAKQEIAFEQSLKIEEGTAFSKYVSADGLEKLANAGLKVWEETTNHSLPHNLIVSQMSGSVGSVGPYGRKMPLTEADQEIEFFARFGGWLREASNFKCLSKAIKKGQSENGLNSWKTLFDLKAFFKLYKSPGRADYALFKARVQADKILSAYSSNCKAAWGDLAYGLVKAKGNYRKAAFIAVARAIINETSYSYKQARENLEWFRSSRFDASVVIDGTQYQIDKTTEIKKEGFAIYEARFTSFHRLSKAMIAISNTNKVFAMHMAPEGSIEYMAKKAEIAFTERSDLEECLYRYGFAGDIEIVDEVPTSYPHERDSYHSRWFICALHNSDAHGTTFRGVTSLEAGAKLDYQVQYKLNFSLNGYIDSIDINRVIITNNTDHQTVINEIEALFLRSKVKAYVHVA